MKHINEAYNNFIKDIINNTGNLKYYTDNVSDINVNLNNNIKPNYLSTVQLLQYKNIYNKITNALYELYVSYMPILKDNVSKYVILRKTALKILINSINLHLYDNNINNNLSYEKLYSYSKDIDKKYKSFLYFIKTFIDGTFDPVFGDSILSNILYSDLSDIKDITSLILNKDKSIINNSLFTDNILHIAVKNNKLKEIWRYYKDKNNFKKVSIYNLSKVITKSPKLPLRQIKILYENIIKEPYYIVINDFKIPVIDLDIINSILNNIDNITYLQTDIGCTTYTYISIPELIDKHWIKLGYKVYQVSYLSTSKYKSKYKQTITYKHNIKLPEHLKSDNKTSVDTFIEYYILLNYIKNKIYNTYYNRNKKDSYNISQLEIILKAFYDSYGIFLKTKDTYRFNFNLKILNSYQQMVLYPVLVEFSDIIFKKDNKIDLNILKEYLTKFKELKKPFDKLVEKNI